MRSLLVLILLVGALALFAASRSHVRYVDNNAWVEAVPTSEAPVVRVTRPHIVVSKPMIKRTKRSANKESAYTFAVKGYAPTTEEAKKDALVQASQVVTAALKLNHTLIEETRLEKMATETQDGSDVPLGTSDGKELGAGKQVSMTFELSIDYIRELGQSERRYLMFERMGWLSRGLAVIVAGLFAVSGYVRLDEWSKGYFSGVLITVAILAVIGAGSAVYFLR